MPKTPAISIVTPTREMPGFLEEAIRSVATLGLPVEYIVVDGGDDAETPRVVRAHRDVVTHYVREPDRGQADAINKGFQLATGDIVAWLNADDYYFPEAAQLAARAFAADPELALLYGDAVYVDRAGQFLRYFTEVEPFDPARLLNDADFICQPTTFFRRQALEAVGFLDSSLHFAMDWDLWCRLARAGLRAHYEPTLVAAVREYDETKTKSGGLRRWQEILKVNWRHHTARLPTASVSFAVGLLEDQPALSRAIAFGRRLKHRFVPRDPVRPLYGLLHRSSFALARARIAVPLVGRKPRMLRLSLGAVPDVPEQEVAVRISGELVGSVRLTPEIPACVGELPLPASVGAILDVELEAEHPGRADGVCYSLRQVTFAG